MTMNMKDFEKLKELQKAKEETLKNLLDEKVSDGDKQLIQRSKMGHSTGYMGRGSLRWIDKNIKLFTELQLFRDKGKIDSKGQFVIDENVVAELEQRAPSWTRQMILTLYLVKQKNRLFPPMVVAVTENWVDDPSAPEWDNEERATKTSMPIEFIDSKQQIGITDLSKHVSLYVLDGSHRLLGIRGLLELYKEGRLFQKKADGTSTKSFITKDELTKDFGFTSTDLDRMVDDEEVGILFIPAVIKGETRKEARTRIRSVFVHINKTAVPPTSGEQVLLDEDDGFSIISRQVGLSHPLFKKEKFGDRIAWKGNAIPIGSNWITTASTLRDLSEKLLGEKMPYRKWDGKKKHEISLRPDDDEIENGIVELNGFLNRLCELRTFKSVRAGSDIDYLREFPAQLSKRKKGKLTEKPKSNLLLRPVGQLIFAEAIGKTCYTEDVTTGHPLLSLDNAFEKLQKLDEEGAFDFVYEPTSYWYGVTYNPHRGTMVMDGRSVGEKLIRYLLGALPNLDEQKDLLQGFRQSRTFMIDEDKYRAFDLNGNEHTGNYDDVIQKIQLPMPL
jgi:DGQHR domain-containing protein